MRIVLATGIYPPDIGGPATYVENLARELSKKGNDVKVVTYGEISDGRYQIADGWNVFLVAKNGGPLLRWWRYSRALKKHAADTDVIVAFSSVSVGVPLMLARLKKPKKILRLGGDFFWERYTDRGGMMSLAEWHASPSSWIWRRLMQMILHRFDHVVYSSAFQRDIHVEHYALPSHSVIENASPSPSPSPHHAHDPFRLLFMGRFVGFKNLIALIAAVADIREFPVALTMVGDGPLREKLKAISYKRSTTVEFLSPVSGAEKQKIFAEHNLLVLPSLTEISPNVALEARAAGLPVLLSEQTGLSEHLRRGMILAVMRTPEQIRDAIRDAKNRYEALTTAAAGTTHPRSWQTVAEEYSTLFSL